MPALLLGATPYAIWSARIVEAAAGVVGYTGSRRSYNDLIRRTKIMWETVRDPVTDIQYRGISNHPTSWIHHFL